MDIAFISVFIVALIFTLFAFIVMEDDTRKKSYRPIFLLAIAIAAWITSITLLITPMTSTIVNPAYNVTLSIEGTNTVIMLPASNSTLNENTPLPTFALYEYMAFAGAMALICIILLVQFVILKSVKVLQDGLEEL